MSVMDPPDASLVPLSEIEKPWVKQKDPHSRWAYYITYAVAVLGIVASGIRCYFGWAQVPRIKGKLCLILDEEFNGSQLDETIWEYELSTGGFGDQEFQITTASSNDTFIRDGSLYIPPTLTSDVIGRATIMDGYTYNVTGCTTALINDASTSSPPTSSCGAVSNHSTGAVINPVMSSRLTTKQSKNIQFGRVEIRAKIPNGDWINEVWRTYGWWTQRRSSYADDFHTYALEWTQDFLRIYVDSRLHHMLDLRFNVPFFDRGNFPPVVTNGTDKIVLQNPWVHGTADAPFDKPFYLIMDVAVGGTNGWFPDNEGGKPWIDGAQNAMQRFALAQDEWYATWPKNDFSRALVVDYVKMWQLC
ncbi:glycoside hydrolase family 16 protein [Jaapia argillacea MUCL 33604]|uniref:Glycoside hydrolase family 16 protein n=1 Tax=Jaapia argillacea MUCL 33604 TaxID=933084 RepID=A0A067PTM5_9AGAM|nr:glycoside hydrolase family 16 protein [Jaapia argillacea MUCL 33604]